MILLLRVIRVFMVDAQSVVSEADLVWYPVCLICDTVDFYTSSPLYNPSRMSFSLSLSLSAPAAIEQEKANA